MFDALPPEAARDAFSHSSWVAERPTPHERLAFLGDSVLSLAISTALMNRFAGQTAGRLTKIRAQAVSRRACAEVAIGVDVPRRLLDASPANQRDQLEALTTRESVLAEAVEAGIGACFLRYGFERTSGAVVAAFAPQVEAAAGQSFDFKSELLEKMARLGESVTYTVVGEQGPPHDRHFETVAEIEGRRVGLGTGRSKKESEQEAARQALETLEAREGR